MRKSTGGDATAATDTPPAADAADAAPPVETAAEVTDAATTEGEQHFDPKHEWPFAGGCYVRQEDGTLKRED